MNPQELNRHVLWLAEILEDRMPELLTETCEGCHNYRVTNEPDEGGRTVCGGVPMRMIRRHECEASSFRDCPKMKAIIESLRRDHADIDSESRRDAAHR